MKIEEEGKKYKNENKIKNPSEPNFLLRSNLGF
jgi:hypothetical protein